MTNITNATTGITGFGQSAPAKTTQPSGGNFADMLASEIKPSKDQLAKTAQNELKERILKIGFNQYVAEQKEAERMQKILDKLQKLLAAQDEEAAKEMQKFVDHFKANPPQSAQEMVEYMSQEIAKMPAGGEHSLQSRMESQLAMIQKLMSTDPEIAKQIEARLLGLS